jgi:tRNA threonylcarbamoyladenosine modification (KEOPS) complex  Pcc1 subunit
MLPKTSKQSELGFSLKLFFPDEKEAQTALKAVQPELKKRNSKRSSSALSLKKTTISINIKARDKTALRASINTCMNSFIVAKRAMEV